MNHTRKPAPPSHPAHPKHPVHPARPKHSPAPKTHTPGSQPADTTRKHTHILRDEPVLAADVLSDCVPPTETNNVVRDGAVLKYKKEAIRLVGYGDYGMVTCNNFHSHFHKYFQTLHKYKLNFSRVWVNHHFNQSLTPFVNDPRAKRDKTCKLKVDARHQHGHYDLTKPYATLYGRLKEFVQLAEAQGIIVQVCLFDNVMLKDRPNCWPYCPYNVNNNVNCSYVTAATNFKATDGPVWETNKQVIQNVVQTLGGFGNVLYEICNEPAYPLIDSKFLKAVGEELRRQLYQQQPDGSCLYTGSKVICSNGVPDDDCSKPTSDDGKAWCTWAKDNVDVYSIHLAQLNPKNVTPEQVPAALAGLRAKAAEACNAADRPFIVSTDGYITTNTRSQYKHANQNNKSFTEDMLSIFTLETDQQRAAETKRVADAILPGSAVGHAHLEFLDRGLNGDTWGTTSPYDPTKTALNATLLKELQKHLV